MKALVYHGPADIRFDSHDDPALQCDTDAIVKVCTFITVTGSVRMLASASAMKRSAKLSKSAAACVA
jgi:hypothetical protein